MLPSSHGKFAAEDFSAAGEARACFGVMSAKEFLVVATVFLILCDLCDVYGNIVRVTGWTHLPFPGNVTAMYYTQIKELNWYDLVISVIDAWCVMLLSLAVCAESLDGLVCSLCGFASSMILELVYVLWLSALVFADSVEEVRDADPPPALSASALAGTRHDAAAHARCARAARPVLMLPALRLRAAPCAKLVHAMHPPARVALTTFCLRLPASTPTVRRTYARRVWG